MSKLGSTPSSAKGGSASGGNSPLQRGRIISETSYRWERGRVRVKFFPSPSMGEGQGEGDKVIWRAHRRHWVDGG